MPVNSHTQLNKAMMKLFSFKAEDPSSGEYKSKVDTVYYLDIKAKEIKTEKISKLGTKFGYFSDRVEKELGDAEHNIGLIVAEFEKWEQDCSYNLSTHEKEINEFINLLLARSELKQDQCRQIATHVFLDKYKGDKDFLSKHPTSVMPTPFVENYGATLMINHTNMNFVIPKNGFISQKQISPMYIFPINTKRAMVLFDKSKEFKQFAPFVPIIDIDNEQSLLAINNSALLTEKMIDQGFVISKTREDLVPLLEFIKSDKWELYK